MFDDAYRQDLRLAHARNHGRRHRSRRGHGRIRVLPALAAPPALFRGAHALGPGRRPCRKVALTVDADDASSPPSSRRCEPDLLQLHGAESTERVADIRARYGLPVMKAHRRLGAGRTRPRSRGLPPCRIASCSTPSLRRTPGTPAATALAFDWEILAGLDLGKPCMLSGGLDAENVARRRWPSPVRPAWMCPPASRARPASRIPPASPHSCMPRGRARAPGCRAGLLSPSSNPVVGLAGPELSEPE